MTHQQLEHKILGYYSEPREHAMVAEGLRLSPHSMQQLAASYRGAVCAKCAQPISEAAMLSRRMKVGDGRIFHDTCFDAAGQARLRDCQARLDAHKRWTPPAVHAAPRKVIAWVSAKAMPYEEACYVRRADGITLIETYERDAFRDAIKGQHGIPLWLNHERAIPGEITFCDHPDGLHFVAQIHDSPAGRELLRQRHLITGCSVAMTERQARAGLSPTVTSDKVTVERASLKEISVLTSPNKPAVHGTYAKVVSAI